jgi:uncharacterized protein with gpF-like domain
VTSPFPLAHESWCWVVEHPGEGYPCGCWVGPYNAYVEELERAVQQLSDRLVEVSSDA